MIYPDSFEQKVGFDKIRRMVEEKCITKLAKEKLADTSFSSSFDVVSLRLELTDEMRTVLMMEDSFPDNTYVDVVDFLKKIRVEGTFLDGMELLALSKALTAARELSNFFNKREDEKYPSLRQLSSTVAVLPAVIAKLDAVVNKFGKVKDNASPELAQVRRTISDKQRQITKRMHAILRSAQQDGIADEDAGISIRDGRMVIPVNAYSKRKLKGFVHDESATGKTVYIEPIEVVDLNNEIKELEYAERREVVKVLVAAADFLRPYLDEMLATGDYIGEIDFIRAKALFSMGLEAVKPILYDEQSIRLINARHPLLMQSLKKEGKEVVPLALELTKQKHILLISGPNAGGKSVCLKTVGLLQYMLQCGLLIPASENSEVGLFNDIFIDIGDEQSIENDLSTYSSHLLNMKNFVRYATDKSLVLIDEFGTGTEPSIGGAIAEAVLAKLTERNTFGVITTHYTNLKYYAASAPGIINGAMLFDTQRIQPLFKLEIGVPGSSFAFEIARKIGLPEEILFYASEKMGDKQVNIEKNLRNIARDRRYWEEKRQRIRLTDKRLEEVTAKYEAELKELKEQRKSIINKAKEEAARLLADTNRQIENTIREIRETQAEKERTKESRAKLERLKESLQAEVDDTNNEKIERKIQQLRDRQEKREQRKAQTKNNQQNEEQDTEIPAILEPGVKVRIKGQDSAGELIKLNGNNAIVAIGSILTNIKADRLEVISNNEFRQTTRNTPAPSHNVNGFNLSQRKSNFKSTIDVRGMRVEEVLPTITEFIDEALMVGTSEVRILHGKGNGILKETIRNLLKTFGGVKSCKDERVEQGGSGITVVELE
ncbi:MAG: Smr/MutS family protein [Prevotellaceae bacterium]|jgi:DNA mismatch repair protein MutS2|nr:Smr/MutS family protein [Prevotellaceae bacterium]